MEHTFKEYEEKGKGWKNLIINGGLKKNKKRKEKRLKNKKNPVCMVVNG